MSDNLPIADMDALVSWAEGVRRATNLPDLAQHSVAMAAALSPGGSSVVMTRPSAIHDWVEHARRGDPNSDMVNQIANVVRTWPPDDGPRVSTIDAHAPTCLVASFSYRGQAVAALAAVCGTNNGFTQFQQAAFSVVTALIDTAQQKLRSETESARRKVQHRLITDERDQIAAAFQRSLAPSVMPAIGHVSVAACFRPMSEGIGGDFYDLFARPEGDWFLALGDVCGKGPAAGATAASVRNALRAAALNHPDPSHALTEVNRALVSDYGPESPTLVTAICAVVRTRGDSTTLTIANAGHPPPLILRRDGTVETLPRGGLMLGVRNESRLDDRSRDLAPGDACVFYSDGATDVRGHDGVFGEERLVEVVAGCRGLNPHAIAESIKVAVLEFQGDVVEDDLALLVLGVPPSLVG